MHNATAITTGSANQRPNTPCIRLWIDVTFRGLEHSYCKVVSGCLKTVLKYIMSMPEVAEADNPVCEINIGAWDYVNSVMADKHPIPVSVGS